MNPAEIGKTISNLLEKKNLFIFVFNDTSTNKVWEWENINTGGTSVHREDGPAIMWYNGRKQWFLNGSERTDSKWKL